MTTGIEWTEITWNPVTGCDRISPGCGDDTGGGCYARRGQPTQGESRDAACGAYQQRWRPAYQRARLWRHLYADALTEE